MQVQDNMRNAHHHHHLLISFIFLLLHVFWIASGRPQLDGSGAVKAAKCSCTYTHVMISNGPIHLKQNDFPAKSAMVEYTMMGKKCAPPRGKTMSCFTSCVVSFQVPQLPWPRMAGGERVNCPGGYS